MLTCPVTPAFPRATSKGTPEKCSGSGASCSTDGSWSSWHTECRFQEKPQRAGALRDGMSLKFKPLGICALRRRPEATRLSKVNAISSTIPSMGTACPSGPGASLKPWLLSLRCRPQESSEAKMIFTGMWWSEHWNWSQKTVARVIWRSHLNSELGLPFTHV